MRHKLNKKTLITSNRKTVDFFNPIDWCKMFNHYSEGKKCSNLENRLFHSIGHISRLIVIYPLVDR